MKQFDMKSSAHLALLVALGKARHWEVNTIFINSWDS
jgi:hypothetical protein